MFQFPRFAFDPYEFRIKYLLLISANARPSWQTASQLQISKVGFPIRKSADQSLFAAPHGLSQRTTSFIASQRQGIHRIPLRHLIALITNAHRSAATTTLFRGRTPRDVGRKDQFCFKRIRGRCGQAAPTTENARTDIRSLRLLYPLIGCISSSRCQIRRDAHRALRETAFYRTNRRRRRASGGARRDRTDDLMLAKHALSQLSYGPVATWMNGGPGRT